MVSFHKLLNCKSFKRGGAPGGEAGAALAALRRKTRQRSPSRVGRAVPPEEGSPRATWLLGLAARTNKAAGASAPVARCRLFERGAGAAPGPRMFL